MGICRGIERMFGLLGVELCRERADVDNDWFPAWPTSGQGTSQQGRKEQTMPQGPASGGRESPCQARRDALRIRNSLSIS